MKDTIVDLVDDELAEGFHAMTWQDTDDDMVFLQVGYVNVALPTEEFLKLVSVLQKTREKILKG